MTIKSKGPQPASILIVGEAPGETEDIMGTPFVGASGQELRRMLTQAGIDIAECRLTNVFMDRPEGNKIDNFCGKKADVGGKDYPFIPLSQGKYFHRELAEGALAHLRVEIDATQPKLVLALGNTPCWALLERTGINKLRGALYPLALSGTAWTCPVLPTFHPAYILRAWSDRPIAVTDFLKANRFVTEGFHVPRRELWLAPTLEECERFVEDFIFSPWERREWFGPLSFDVETFGGTVTCIGFAPSEDRAITIPFYDPTAPDRNYWPDADTERKAWGLVRRVLESEIPKLGQNGLYDVQYCHRWKIKVHRYLHDTMIRHHALEPEMPKGLGFLATIYTDEAQWKVLRDRNKDNFKLEDE